MFEELLNKYGVSHTYTGVYAPQSNASERVNRSLIASIRAYIQGDQKRWDVNLSAITCALRNSIHQSIGSSPYYLSFGQHMITHASTYEILRKLEVLEESGDKLDRPDKLKLIRERAKLLTQRAFETNKKTYNLRARKRDLKPGQIVYRRNFKQSKASAHYNAKLDLKFIKCRVVKKNRFVLV